MSQTSTGTAPGGPAGPTGPAEPAGSPTVPYHGVTNPRSQYASFNPEVVRGLAFDTVSSPDRLYSINAYAGTLMRFDLDATPTPDPEWRMRTVADPVAVLFQDPYVYVLGQGNHTLAKHAKDSGELLELLNLPSEPADILVDSAGDAWISCMGADSVVRVDLTAMAIEATWGHGQGLALKRPRFLSLDPGSSGKVGTPGAPERVLVAPFVSGNGSFMAGKQNDSTDGTVDDPRTLSPSTIHDGTDPVEFGDSFMEPYGNDYGILPDEDLFAINVNGLSDAYPVARGVSTLLTGHGFNPATNAYWMLGIDLENQDPARQSEPALNGNFADNELNLLDGDLPTGPGGPLVTAPGVPDAMGGLMNRDIDSLVTGQQVWDPTGEASLSFPYALAFGEVLNGRPVAAVAGSTTPNVALFDTFGRRLSGTDMPIGTASIEGRVVRSLQFFGNELFIYCQETGNIIAWPMVPNGPFVKPADDPDREYDLGADPSPASIRRGRSVWYDAVGSMNGRVSCNTCHPGGEADGLAWSLKDDLTDFKDPMVTQTMKGALDAFPFHWRGERDLIDFNGAFTGLLGMDDPLDEDPDAEHGFADFQAFVFSLQPAANPLQPIDRELRDTSAPHAQPNGMLGDPQRGQELFLGAIPINGGTGTSDCSRCHAFPTGSIGNPRGDNNTNIAHTINDDAAMGLSIETASLHNLNTLRQQPFASFLHRRMEGGLLRESNYRLPRLGFGYRHNGVDESNQDFVKDQFMSAGGISAQNEIDSADIGSFLDLWDSGTAPAVHHARRLNADTVTAQEIVALRSELLNQAASDKRWIDVVVIGRSPSPRTWWFDPSAGAGGEFVCEDPGVANVTLAAFLTPGWDNFFLGCLPGQGRRLGIDYDDDGLRNGAESSLDPFDPDFDNDGFPDGYEALTPGLNPTVHNVAGDNLDGVAPRLSPVGTLAPELDFVSARLAKYHFETTEPARWSAVVRSLTTQDPEFELHSNVMATRHTIGIRKLLPSGNLAMGSPQWDHRYEIDLTLTDYKGLDATVTFVVESAHTGKDDREFLVVRGSALDQLSASGGARTLRYTALLGNLDELSRTPDVDKMIAVQLLTRPDEDSPWVPVPEAELQSSPGNAVNRTILMDAYVGGALSATHTWNATPAGGSAQFPGAILVGKPTLNSVVRLDFTVTGAAALNQLGVQPLQIFEQSPANLFDPSASATDVHVRYDSRGDYNFPFTEPVHRLTWID